VLQCVLQGVLQLALRSVSAQEWSNRKVAEHACSKMGRAAARRNAPKQPRAIRAGPNEGAQFFLGSILGVYRIFPQIPGVYGILFVFLSIPGVYRIRH